ncbi:hypothetical protein E2C01_051203 [Portunus trituberculatus]|uniref:Uncharacterized protein n=1 Tax=Portunus trituberculatus TaxID=210409 RepID=A0A5B7GIY1_PORTR|nr:hypothetical protein [Portunus trituberculatus]
MECDRYEEERKQPVAQITEIIGEQELNKRLAEEDGGITTVLGLYNDTTSFIGLSNITAKILPTYRADQQDTWSLCNI